MPSLFELRNPGATTRRFLFVVPPLAEHVNPTVALGAELVSRGHQVAWTGDPALAPLLEPGSQLFPAEDPALTAKLRAAREAWRGLSGADALRFRWQEFIVPLGHAMVPGVEAAVATFRPDVVIADQHALAGSVAARRKGLPWATAATTSTEFTRPLDAMPEAEQWVRERMLKFQRVYRQEGIDLRFSDHLVLAFCTASLIGSTEEFPDHFAFVGPSFGRREQDAAFPWDDLTDQYKILVTLGRTPGPGAERFFRAAAEAVSGMNLQAIFVVPDGLLPTPPPNVIARPRIPQLEVLRHVSAVVCHGGHDTVCEALAAGLPLVVAPTGDDQPVIVRQIVAAGAGLTVRYPRIQADELRTAVGSVLTDPVYRAAAGRIQASFNAAGGPAEAADRLEKLT